MRPLPAVCFCAALLAGAPARAGDWSPDTDRILGDPAYLPLRGQLFGEFSYSHAVGSDQALDNGPFAPVTDSFHQQTEGFAPFLQYGITDTLSLSANLDWGSARTSETFLQTRLNILPLAATTRQGPLTAQNALVQALAGLAPQPRPPRFSRIEVPVSIDRRSIGAQDPAFALTWRAIGQDRAAVDLDLSAAYAPDIFQGRAASFEATGTRAAGGQRATAQAAISREMHRLTLRATATFGYDGRRDVSGIGEVSRSGAHADAAAGVQSQVRLLSFLALNAGASVSRAVRFDVVDTSTFQGTTVRSPDTIRPATDIAPYAGLVFPLLGRRAVGELLYERDVVSDEKTDFTRFTHQGSNVFSASVRFVLG